MDKHVFDKGPEMRVWLKWMDAIPSIRNKISDIKRETGVDVGVAAMKTFALEINGAIKKMCAEKGLNWKEFTLNSNSKVTEDMLDSIEKMTISEDEKRVAHLTEKLCMLERVFSVDGKTFSRMERKKRGDGGHMETCGESIEPVGSDNPSNMTAWIDHGEEGSCVIFHMFGTLDFKQDMTVSTTPDKCEEIALK